jgi:predicted nucleic acid-binding protein
MPSSDAGALDAPTHSPVVSDTSPLVHLSRVGLFSLLEAFYGRLLIPPAVWREAVEEGRGRVGEAEVRAAVGAGWIDIRTPTDAPLLRLLKQELDDGEAEGIALASEVGADLIVVDEAPARKSARAAGLRVTGTLGILIRARSEGHLGELRPVLDRLRLESFRISDVLYRRALEGVGEEP